MCVCGDGCNKNVWVVWSRKKLICCLVGVSGKPELCNCM